MINKEQAQELARIHVEELNNKDHYIKADYNLLAGEWEDYEEFWMIKYNLIYKEHVPEEKQSPVGGGPIAFTISKITGEVDDIGFWQFINIKQPNSEETESNNYNDEDTLSPKFNNNKIFSFLFKKLLAPLSFFKKMIN